MSFLAGRLAGTEGAYFLQESKQAVSKIIEKSKTHLPSSTSPTIKPLTEESADVLPEILRHSLPSKIFQNRTSNSSSLSSSSKWALHSDPNLASSVSPDVLNPLRGYLSLPQVTFGPKRWVNVAFIILLFLRWLRWNLPNTDNSVLASTANEMRRDRYTHVKPEKLKAAADGFSQIGKAFAAATLFVFGGASLTLGLAASKLEMHNADDIRTKGKDIVQPKFEAFKQQLIPLRSWADNMSKKWHFEREQEIKEKPVIKELSRILGAKPSN
ncbi:hypothetical protein RJ641_017255 [Dillenia turbinata]|uniref:Uncharacterized protein n=1 Tax=Dillenia turbinata TaxID=194707 RepID=A0AAN8UL21_9MAGN